MLKFMDVGYIIVLSLLEKHSVHCDVDGRQRGHKAGLNMQGVGVRYTDRQTRDGTDVDDSAEKRTDQCNKSLIFKKPGMNKASIHAAWQECNKRYADVTDHSGITTLTVS